MLQRLCHRRPGVGVLAEHAPQEVEALFGGGRPSGLREVLRLHLVGEVRAGVVPDEHGVHHHAKRPHVHTVCHRLARRHAVDDLGRHELRRASERHEVGVREVGEAKVDHLQRCVPGRQRVAIRLSPREEKVLGFQISVHHATAVEMPCGEQHLHEEQGDLVLGQAALGDQDTLEHVAALAQLEHQMHCIFLLVDLEEFDDVRVVHPLQDVRLMPGQPAGALHAVLHDLGAAGGSPASRLHGPAGTGDAVRSCVDLAVPTLTQRLAVQFVHVGEFGPRRAIQAETSLLADKAAGLEEGLGRNNGSFGLVFHGRPEGQSLTNSSGVEDAPIRARASCTTTSSSVGSKSCC
mmetsp:Transcript_73320/g.238641  ORF Transcript_73320/g.238641 Transcript_73320/m.238641 type:complete len:349 (-) Transcript_73320:27-1073(-)